MVFRATVSIWSYSRTIFCCTSLNCWSTARTRTRIILRVILLRWVEGLLKRSKSISVTSVLVLLSEGCPSLDTLLEESLLEPVSLILEACIRSSIRSSHWAVLISVSCIVQAAYLMQVSQSFIIRFVDSQKAEEVWCSFATHNER